MKKFFAIATLALASTLAACSNKDVSFDTLELARGTAKSNAEYNAKSYRANSAQYGNFALETQGDSTQRPDCPQGDGWATQKLVSKENPAIKVVLKCSTVSGSIGCMTEAEFSKKPYASDDGQCQPTTKVPFPLPKIAQ